MLKKFIWMKIKEMKRVKKMQKKMVNVLMKNFEKDNVENNENNLVKYMFSGMKKLLVYIKVLK